MIIVFFFNETFRMSDIGIVQILFHHFRGVEAVCKSMTIDDSFQGGGGVK